MAKPEDKTHQFKPKLHTFLRCFGFSVKISRKIDSENKTMKPANYRKRNRLFSFFLRKKDTKTVAFDTNNTTFPAKPKKSSKSKSDELLLKLKAPSPGTNQNPQNDFPAVPPVASEQASNVEPKHDACQSRLCRRIESFRIGFSQQNSPAKNRKSNVRKSDPPRNKRTVKSHTDISDQVKKSRGDQNIASEKKFDPIIGMSVIMTTLLIMLSWGRLCAILCTAAWFYFIPSLRSAVHQFDVDDRVVDRNGSKEYSLDLFFDEYKRKVVFEGFVKRNRRPAVL